MTDIACSRILVWWLSVLLNRVFRGETLPHLGSHVFREIRKTISELSFFSDSLVQYFQLVYDGDIFGWPCQHDINENTEKRLRQIQQRG